MSSSTTQTLPLDDASRYWRGLGLWNLYFLAKFGLTWVGALNFHPLANLAFAAGLLCPLPPRWLHRLRHIAALPVGVALLYYDSWFPPFSRLIAARSDITALSPYYLFELAQRLINPDILAAGLILGVAYLFFSQWLRLTTINMVGLIYFTVVGTSSPPPHATAAISARLANDAVPAPAVWSTPSTLMGSAGSTYPPQTLPPSDENLNTYLNAFYHYEQQRKTNFAPPTSQSVPFDLLIINICSMSWSDLDTANLRNHRLFAKMDIIFDEFNSATSYSGPSAIRLFRASCGQQPHQKLYAPQEPECFLFKNLGQLGFNAELVLNHTGQYQNYLDNIREQGNMPAPAVQTRSLSHLMVSFDGTPIWNDLDILNRWWQQRQKNSVARTAMFYNSITLHDGNRVLTTKGSTQPINYQQRAQRLLNDLSTFLDKLESSGRRIVVAIVPEHGAALHADRMQIKGMREIPSPSITHVPVAVKLLGMKKPYSAAPVHITGPSSYLALSELVARLANGLVFTATDFDWNTLIADLPLTAPVAENAGVVVLRYQTKPFVRLNDDSWLPYPE